MKASFYILMAMIIWGSLGLVVRLIALPSVEIVFVRALIASVFLIIAKKFFSKDKVDYKSKSFFILIVSGIALGANWMFLFQAYKYTTIVNATLSYYMAPVFAIILAMFFLKERTTFKSFISILMAVAGLTLIVMQQTGGSAEYKNHTLGIIFGLIAALLYASVIVLNKKIVDVSGFDKSLIQIFMAFIVLLPIVCYRNMLYIENTQMLLLCLVIGIVHTGIPYLIYFSNIKKVSIQSVAILSYADPLTAVILSGVFLHEPMGIYHYIGGFLILAAAFIKDE